MLQELIKSNDFQTREILPFNDIIMMIFRYNISSARCNRTVHKLIIIRILLNQIKIKIDIDKHRIWTTNNCIYYIFGSFPIGQHTQNFLILIQYGSRNA